MPQYKGASPMIDANNIAANFAWYPRIVAKTAAYTVTPQESGTIFTTTGATQAINFTLPAISTGPWVFYFIAGAAQNLTVTAETADTMVTFNDLQADSIALSTSGEIIGGGFMAFCDGTTLFCSQVFGVSHRQTATIATA
jgi:hypothetical protein